MPSKRTVIELTVLDIQQILIKHLKLSETPKFTFAGISLPLCNPFITIEYSEDSNESKNTLVTG